MIKLDDKFLTAGGLERLPAERADQVLRHVLEALETRVGMILASRMSSEELDEFEALIAERDEPGMLRWLEMNRPDYRDLVETELLRLQGELRSSAPALLAAAGVSSEARLGWARLAGIESP